eukprot:scaffold90_cov264-Pinguiococcus_pyrenoidosus.AAC.26
MTNTRSRSLAYTQRRRCVLMSAVQSLPFCSRSTVRTSSSTGRPLSLLKLLDHSTTPVLENTDTASSIVAQLCPSFHPERPLRPELSWRLEAVEDFETLEVRAKKSLTAHRRRK